MIVSSENSKLEYIQNIMTCNALLIAYNNISINTEFQDL